MRYILCIFTVVLIGFFQGCANQSVIADTDRPPDKLPSQADLVGTWRYISVTEGGTGKVHSIANNQVFFIRFYADGKCASWPVPEKEIIISSAFNTDAKRISRGVYKMENGQLTLPDAPDTGKVQVRISARKMWYSDDEGDTYLYYKVCPDLEPGQLP